MTDYFIKGAISGAAGILCSHPIDTIKSNIQDNKPVNFKPRFLFRGIVPPFFGMGLEKAIVFGVYHNTLNSLNQSSKNKKGNVTLNRCIAGSIAGFAASFVVTPIERLKILAQTKTDKIGKNKIGKMGLAYLYQGLSSTFTREMPGFAIYFSVYESMKDNISTQRNLTMIDHFVMGGISGFLAWFFIYPQDIVKTRIQAATTKKTPVEIIREIYKHNGVKGFFRGFHLALLRAVPLHAGTFAMFEYLNKKF